MKRFLPIFIAALLTIPVLGQKTAKERLQAMNYQVKVSAEAPGKNFSFPATASRHQPFHLRTHHAPREKNTRVLMQQMDSYVYQDYDASTSSWINTTMFEFSYDGSGNNTRDVFSTWNPDTELFGTVAKQEFTYTNGNLTEKLYYEWDTVENIYVQLYKSTYTYNGAGHMTISNSYFFDGSVWQLSDKDECTYDAAGNMVQQIKSGWGPSGDEWVNFSKLENSYNDSGALLGSTTSYWDESTGSWYAGSREEYTYTGSGQMISTIHMFWNSNDSQWLNIYKYEYTYDGNMNMVMMPEFVWDGVEWLNVYKRELDYNNTYTSNEILLPWMFKGRWDIVTHMLTGITDYEYSGQSFVMVGRSQYNYSQVNLTAMAEPETMQPRIYPQPASERVTFDWDSNQPTLELGIYDSNGKKLLSQQLDNHSSVNIEQLAPGLYFYRLADNHITRLTGKISVK